MDLFNRALLGKWVWRFVVEENSNFFINTKYSSDLGGWFSNSPKGSCGTGLWKVIAKHLDQIKKDCEFVLGNNKRISFWEDYWSGRGPLSCLFQTLYSISGSKSAKTVDLWEEAGEGGV